MSSDKRLVDWPPDAVFSLRNIVTTRFQDDPPFIRSATETVEIARSRIDAHASAQGNYLAAAGTLTQFNAIMAALLGTALTAGGVTLRLASACAMFLHVIAAFVLCWAARPVEPGRHQSSEMALVTSTALVDDTFRNYRRGWRLTLLALTVSSVTMALFVLSTFGISWAEVFR